jgi:hypothetical protein
MGSVLAIAVAVLSGTACNWDGVRDRDVYVIEAADLTFQVNAAGARITDVHLRGSRNLLTQSSVNAIDYGSTFWTSPQSRWGWPPPKELDSDAFAASPTPGSGISFVGPTDVALGASVSKRFVADVANARIDAAYAITAQRPNQMFAPWEITRVLPGGLTFYPTGSGAPAAGAGFALPPTKDAAGCTWYQHPGVAPGADQKLLADGSGGWLAHVAGDTVLVKTFADVPAGLAAPGEAEIEIFVQGRGDYVEMEQQGAYQAVAEGDSLTWPVTWIVRRLPEGMAAVAGNPELVAFVQSVVGPP